MKNTIFFILIILSIPVLGQYDYSPACIRAHDLITSLKFGEARSALDSIRSEDPDNLIPVVLENYIDFLTILVGENKAEFDSLEEATAWADADPYMTAGVYAQVSVKPFKKVLP